MSLTTIFIKYYISLTHIHTRLQLHHCTLAVTWIITTCRILPDFKVDAVFWQSSDIITLCDPILVQKSVMHVDHMTPLAEKKTINGTIITHKTTVSLNDPYYYLQAVVAKHQNCLCCPTSCWISKNYTDAAINISTKQNNIHRHG